MEEAEILCDEIAIIDNGKVIVKGSTDDLKNIVSNKSSLKLTVNDISLISVENIKSILGVQNVLIEENTINIDSNKDINNLSKIIDKINEQGAKILDIGYKEITLETVFLTLTGRSLRD